MIDKALNWIERGWWGVIGAYIVVFVTTFVAIWAVLEPMGVGERIDLSSTFATSRIFVHVLAAVVISAHIVIVLLTIKLAYKKLLDAKRFGIKILRPRPGAGVDNPFEVFGSYSKRPPEGALQILEFSPEYQQYWPKSKIVFDDDKKTWSARLHIGGTGNRDIIVAHIGESGRCLIDYYERVKFEAQAWYGIQELTPDIQELDRVQVYLIGQAQP